MKTLDFLTLSVNNNDPLFLIIFGVTAGYVFAKKIVLRGGRWQDKQYFVGSNEIAYDKVIVFTIIFFIFMLHLCVLFLNTFVWK